MIRLLMSEPENVQKKFLKSLKEGCKNGSGVVVLTTGPFERVKRMFGKDKICQNKILFIDTVGEGSNPMTINASNSNLSALSMTIIEALQAMNSKKRFLVFDSITPLLEYNSSKSLCRFFMFLLGKLEEWDVDADIIVTKDRASMEIVPIIGESVDKIIN